MSSRPTGIVYKGFSVFWQGVGIRAFVYFWLFPGACLRRKRCSFSGRALVFWKGLESGSCVFFAVSGCLPKGGTLPVFLAEQVGIRAFAYFFVSGRLLQGEMLPVVWQRAGILQFLAGTQKQEKVGKTQKQRK